MRFVVPIAVLAILGTSTNPTCASSTDDTNFDQQTVEALEAKVEQAHPRERCFLHGACAPDDRGEPQAVCGWRCGKG